MEGIRKKIGRSGILAALFFAFFAILSSFHYHEASAGEAPSHHCAVCHNSSTSKALSVETKVCIAPELPCEQIESFEASASFTPAPIASDPIRGPPLV